MADLAQLTAALKSELEKRASLPPTAALRGREVKDLRETLLVIHEIDSKSAAQTHEHGKQIREELAKETAEGRQHELELKAHDYRILKETHRNETVQNALFPAFALVGCGSVFVYAPEFRSEAIVAFLSFIAGAMGKKFTGKDQ
jgi:hypothetical protein